MKNTPHLFKSIAVCLFSFVFLGVVLTPVFGLHNLDEAGKEETLGNIFKSPQKDVKDSPKNAKEKKEDLPYKSGEVIVKFKDTLVEPADLIFKDTTKPQATIKKDEQFLYAFFAQYKVISVKPLFAEPTKDLNESTGKGVLEKRRKVLQERMDTSRSKYHQRTQRAPQDAVIPDLTHVYLLTLPEEINIDDVVVELNHNPLIVYAQPNYLNDIHWIPNDPFYSSSGSWGQNYENLWGLRKIQPELAWDMAQGEGVTVAVVDTGLDYNHPDIAGNVWINPCEDINGNQQVDPGDFNNVDDPCVGYITGNGYVDDIVGWDFYYKDNNEPMDGHDHGTHVSGTIAAVGNNSVGIIGVAPQSKIMPVKGLSNAGVGFSSDLARAIRYAAENGADVINNSWGCYSRCPSNPVIEDAIRIAYGLGVVTVFSAGNSNDNTAFYSPQNMMDS